MGKYTDKLKELFPSFGKCQLKGILVIIDGLGDMPSPLLNHKTPLESANTPNMNFLAARGELGYMYPVKPGFIPESDEALLSIFGNKLTFNSRGQMEARGTDIKIERGDLALRLNFATINPKTNTIVDRRAGRTLTNAEVEILIEAISQMDFECKFEIKPTVQHAGVLVLRGGFSDNIAGNDLTYIQGRIETDTKVRYPKALEESETAEYTANILNDFISQSHLILEKHPINKERKRKGLLPANYLLIRSPGIEPPKLKPYRRWMSCAYTPMEIGFSKLCGMKTFPFLYPRLNDFDSYANSYDALRKACKFISQTINSNCKGFDYAYVHVKETDLPGHDNKPLEKKTMIEYIDSTLFNFIRKFAPPNQVKVIVTGDHATPCKLKAHSADPVPVLFYNGAIPREREFNEKNSRKGTLGSMTGEELLKKAGFVK